MVNLTVYVSDVNDNSPQFISPDGYQFSVEEGTAGLILGAVEVWPWTWSFPQLRYFVNAISFDKEQLTYS